MRRWSEESSVCVGASSGRGGKRGFVCSVGRKRSRADNSEPVFSRFLVARRLWKVFIGLLRADCCPRLFGIVLFVWSRLMFDDVSSSENWHQLSSSRDEKGQFAETASLFTTSLDMSDLFCTDLEIASDGSYKQFASFSFFQCLGWRVGQDL